MLVRVAYGAETLVFEGVDPLKIPLVRHRGPTCVPANVARVIGLLSDPPEPMSTPFMGREASVQEGTEEAPFVGVGLRACASAVHRTGVCRASLWPDDMVVQEQPDPECYVDARKRRGWESVEIDSETDEVAAVGVRGGLVVATFGLGKEFLKAGAGKPPVGPDVLYQWGHAVTIYGWVPSHGGFLVSDSRDLSWGVGGLGLVSPAWMEATWDRRAFYPR